MVIFREIKIKYDHLDIILEDQLRNIKYGNNVNVIIDLKEMIRKVYRPDMLDEDNITRSDIEELSSDIIGIASHYRNYFYKHGKYTSLYFLYSTSECKIMQDKFADYKKEHYEKYFNDPERGNRHSLVKKAIKISKSILNKVPNCQFIDSSDYDEFVMTKFLIQRAPGNELTLILSNDEIMAQLIKDNVYMIDLKSIHSSLLTQENAISKLFKRSTPLSSNLISLVASILGTQRYSLHKIDQVGPYRAIKAIERLLETEKIMDTDYLTFPVKKESLDIKNTYERMIFDNYDQIVENFGIIRGDDILYSNQTNIKIKFNKPKQTFSASYFLELNAKIFTTYPISIDMLLKGEA